MKENTYPGGEAQELYEFLYALETAGNINQGFLALTSFVTASGFDAVSYASMPVSFGGFRVMQPVFLSSPDFSPDFIAHYHAESLWQQDFTINRIQNGLMAPMDWQRSLLSLQLSDAQRQLIQLAMREFGVHNALTMALESTPHTIAGASVLSFDKQSLYDKLIQAAYTKVYWALSRFHRFVYNSVSHKQHFYQPLLDTLSPKEKRVLLFYATGRPLKQSQKYINLSESRTSNILREIRQRYEIGNSAELFHLIGEHHLIEMFGAPATRPDLIVPFADTLAIDTV